MTIPRIRKGDVIRAPYLNQIADAINDQAHLPENLPGTPAPTDGTLPEDTGANSAETWTETQRETTTVRVENPEDSEQYVDVDRIDSVTLVGPDGQVRRDVYDNT